MSETETLAQVAEALRIAPISLEEMRAHAAAFDAVAFAEATRRHCVALRAADGMLLVVLGDPYDLDTQDWIEERLREPFGYRLAHRLEVAAYLQQQETQLRALDGIAKDVPAGQRGTDRSSLGSAHCSGSGSS